MTTRTKIFLIMAFVSIGAAFLLNMLNFVGQQPETTSLYLQPYDVQGMAVEHNGWLYTLNFDQQNAVVVGLNQAVKIKKNSTFLEGERPAFAKLHIYRFKNSVLEILPLAYVGENLVFSAPFWHPEGWLMDTTDGDLKDVLNKTYDP